MINATYTDILAEIRQFFAQHLLVNSFIDGQLYDFQAKDNVYSAVVLVPTNSTIQNTQLDLAFDLYFVDRINEDGSNTRDVYNDELQIAQDFISYFTNRPNTWNLAPENINIEPFEQRFADILGGWRLSVSVLLPFYKNVCEIPLDEDAPVPPVPPTPPTPPVYKRDHAQLRNLDYEHAGHTGFQPTLTSDNAGNNITITEDSQGNVIINAQVPSAAVWGNITGDLEDQTDLYNLLQLLDQATSDNAQAITTINDKIPSQATSDNQLADKAFVNSSIATATATFMGTVTATGDTEQEAQTALSAITGMDENDYAFVVVEDTPNTGVDKYKRYKYSSGAWLYEYTLNNSSFTANQWNAINSGITSAKVTTYDGYATTKQDTLTAGTNITIVGSTISASGGGGAPIAYPTTASDVQTTAMTLKSSISDNGKMLTECGFVYNTSGSPTLNDNILLADLGVGNIEKVLQGLTQNTTYYIRSYGVNSKGTTYGAELTQVTMGSPIPDEYQLVEYLQSSGTQYILIPQILYGNTEVDITYKLSVISPNAALFGGRTNANYWLFITGANVYRFDYFGAQLTNFSIAANTLTNFKTYISDDNKFEVLQNNIVVSRYSISGNVSCNNIILFNGYTSGTTLLGGISAQMQLAKFYKAGVYDIQLYPVYRILDNKPGMYDIVNNVFYTNQGSGEFTVGPDKQWGE